jgi:hypothetical protein
LLCTPRGATCVVVLALLVGSAERVRAELAIGLTDQNALISFDTATPGTVNTIGAITGLSAGDTLVGIDRRPSLGANNGRLYAVGVNSTDGSARIYTLNETTAVATLGAALAADPADTTTPFPFTTVAGTDFGLDFNPVPDRLRLTSNTGQNLRINVDNGLVQLDVPLAYQSGDPNFGIAPIDLALAYSNNFGGATTTTLRGVDVGHDPDAVVIHSNPNGGTLQQSRILAFNSSSNIAYDISGVSGAPFFAVNTPGSGSSSLYTVRPEGATLIGTIGGDVPLRGLAVPVGPQVPAVSHGAIIHESATLGPTDVDSHPGIEPFQYLGSRFSVDTEVQVVSVGGHVYGNTMESVFFASIVSLSSPTALPSGNPFDTTTIATTQFTPPADRADDILVPLSVTLSPGHYALILGAVGLPGGGMPDSNIDIPGRASYILWADNPPFSTGWKDHPFGGLRFVVTGIVIPEPATAAMLGLALLVVGGWARRRSSCCSIAGAGFLCSGKRRKQRLKI